MTCRPTRTPSLAEALEAFRRLHLAEVDGRRP